MSFSPLPSQRRGIRVRTKKREKQGGEGGTGGRGENRGRGGNRGVNGTITTKVH